MMTLSDTGKVVVGETPIELLVHLRLMGTCVVHF